MSRAPFAAWLGPLPGSNYTPNLGIRKIGSVLHCIVGSEDSANSEFHSPYAHLSATWAVGGPGDSLGDGGIGQWLDTYDVPYAQSNGNWPPPNGNGPYSAIEVAGDPNQPMTGAQCEAVAHIWAYEHMEMGWPLAYVAHGQRGVTTHCNPDNSPDPNFGNHWCPGPPRVAQVPLIVLRAAVLVGGTWPAPPPTPVPPPPGNNPGPLSPTPAGRAPDGNPFTPLVIDGQYGPLTCKALQWSLNYTGANPQLAIDGNPFGIFRALQARLNYTNGPVAIDGVFGPQSIRALQNHVHVSSDGQWGPITTAGIQRSLDAGAF